MTLVFFYEWPTLKFLNAWAMTLYELCCDDCYMKYIISDKFCFLLLNYIWICCWQPNKKAKLVQPVIYCSSSHDDVTLAVIVVLIFNNSHLTSMRVSAVAIFNNGHHDIAAVIENRSSIMVVMMSCRPLLKKVTTITGRCAWYCRGSPAMTTGT